jgi:hypothetical protein
MSILKGEKKVLESAKAQLKYFFNEALEYIMKHFELVKGSIIFDENKYLLVITKKLLDNFYRKSIAD